MRRGCHNAIWPRDPDREDMCRMEALLQLLHDRAADLDDYPIGQGESAWSVLSNSADVMRVEAATKQATESMDDAWQAATDLRDSVLALGYTLHGTSTVGVISDHGDDDHLRVIGWRGYLNVVLRTA